MLRDDMHKFYLHLAAETKGVGNRLWEVNENDIQAEMHRRAAIAPPFVENIRSIIYNIIGQPEIDESNRPHPS